jgi:hypothetical protein
MDFFTRRVRNYLSVLGLFIATAVSAAVINPLTISDFKPGLVTDLDASDICDGCTPDLQNVDLKTGAIVKRRGSVLQNATTLGSFTSQPARFISEFYDTSGTAWFLSVSSNSLFSSSDAGATNTLLTSTFGITSSSRFSMVSAFGKARLTDGATNWILTDGRTVTASTSSPKGAINAFYAERIWTAGVSGSPSVLYASAVGDPEDWTTDTTVDSDATFFNIRQNDGYNIRALKRFKNALLVFKDYSIDSISVKNDGLTFAQNPISNTIGTLFPNSIAERPNDIIWLGHDGYYSYNGSTIKRISDPVKTTVYGIQQLQNGSRIYGETSQTDFGNGTLTNVSRTISAGDVYLSTWTTTDTSSTNFVAGTLTSISTSIVTDSIVLAYANSNVSNNSFESGSTGWTFVGNSAVAVGAAFDGTRLGVGSGTGSAACSATTCSQAGTHYASVYDNAGTTLLQSDSFVYSVNYAAHTIPLSSFRGRNVNVYLSVSRPNPIGGFGCACQEFYDVRKSFLASGTDMTFEAKTAGTDIFFDYFLDGNDSISSGTFVSQIFDTAISSPTWFIPTINDAVNGNTITYELQVATASTGVFDSLVSLTTSAAPTAAAKRFVRYKVTMSTASTGTGLPFMSDMTLSARSLSGRYTSTAIDMTGATSWGQFLGTSLLTSGAQSFEIYTDSNTSMPLGTDGVPTAGFYLSSQTITNGMVPTVAVSTYAHVASTFSVTVATQNAGMADFQLAWNTGGANVPVWSIYYDGDYLSAVAMDGTSVNDTILVYDENEHWLKYRDLPAYGFSLYRQKPYFGSNVQGSIVRFQADGIYNDYNGNAINSYWTSKEFDFGEPLTDKTMLRYYVTALNRTGSTATFSYGVNRGALLDNTMTLDELPGFYRKVFTPTSTTYQIGKSHRFKISNNTSNGRFDILSVTVKPSLETAP